MMSDHQENDDVDKDTTVEQSDQTPMGQRRQRRRRRTAGSRDVSTGTASSIRNQQGILSDSSNHLDFDGFKLRRLLQDHNSSTRLAQWNNREEKPQQVQVHQHHQRPPTISTATAHAYRQFSNPTSPSSYDPTRSIGLPPLSPVLSSPRGSSSSTRSTSSSSRIAARPEGVRMLEPSYPRDSLLHKVMAQPHRDDSERDDGGASQSMPSKKSSPPTSNNDAKRSVRTVPKSLAHHAEPSSLVAIAELSRRYAPPSRTNQGSIGNAGILDAHQLAAHGIGAASSPMDENTAMRTPLQPWNSHHSSSTNFGTSIGSNVGESVARTSKKVHQRESNESGHETEAPREVIATGTQRKNQDSTRSMSIVSLARNIFAKNGRTRADATQGDQAKDIDIVVTTSTTPSTVDESEELSMISMSPRLATRRRNSGDAQQRQELEEHTDRAAVDRGADFILELGHLLGKTCTTFLTPHNWKRRPYHQNNGDDDDLSAASSLSSIAPRVIVSLTASDTNCQRARRKGISLCFRFALIVCKICSFTVAFMIGISIIARRSESPMLGIDDVMPTDEENVLVSKTPQNTWTHKPVLTEPQDVFSSRTFNGSEMELCSDRDPEKEKSFLRLDDMNRTIVIDEAEPSVDLQDNYDMNRTIVVDDVDGLEDMNRTKVVDDVEPSVDLQVNCEEEEDRDGVAVENHLFEEESTENTEAPVYLDAKKDYCDFVSLQKLLKAIFLQRSTKVRAIARIPRTLPTPPQFWQPGKFALPTNTSVPAELVGTMSRALVHVPSPMDLTPIVNIDISNNAISVYTSSSDKDFSDLYYHTLQYNEQTGEDFDIPLSQFLGEILQDYRREKRKRRIEETQLLAGSDHSVEVSTARSKLIRRKKSPLRRLADWLKHSLPFGL